MKTVIITGSSRGIGYAAARYFGQNGWNVVINSCHNLDRLNEARQSLAQEGISVLAIPGDCGDPAFWQILIDRTIETFGTIDCVIHNAALSYVGLITDMELTQWHTLMNTNLNALFYCTKALLPHMLARKEGRILAVTSVWGEVGASCEVAYSASKGGLISFVKALAKELAPSNIQVNALSLGMFDTEMNACFTDEEKAEITMEIPADRMGDPEEAAAMLYQMATGPSYLTGQVIRLDGGWI